MVKEVGRKTKNK